MRASIFIRLGGLAAVVGGVLWSLLWLPGEVLVSVLRAMGVSWGNMQLVDNVVYVLFLLGIMWCLAALHLLQRESYGLLGALASVIVFVGATVLAVELVLAYGVVGGRAELPFYLGLLLITAGLVAVGIVTVGAGSLPRWCGVTILVGSPLFVLLGTVFLGLLGPAAMLPVGIAWLFVGYAVFRAGARLPEASARVR